MTVTNFYMNLMLKAQIDLKYILGEKVNEKEEEMVSDFFYSLLKPTVFWGEKGAEVKHWKDFEMTCNLMRQYGVPEPKKLSVREWYQYLADLTKQLKPKAKGGR